MRKICYFFLSAIMSMLLITSCSNDELQTVVSGDNVQVSFALGLDKQMGSRAADGVINADKLVYALFDADGKLITGMNNSDNGLFAKNGAFASSTSENISMTLVKGQTYSIVFWAQDSDCGAYTITAENDGVKVDVDYQGANNDETRDAFFASETFTVEGNAEVEVVLKRPFAQINLGVTQEDWNAAVASGINITGSKAVIKNAATSINLLDGSVSGETVVTYDFANIPSSTGGRAANVKDLEIDNASYKWLSMSYILTDENKTTLDSDGLQFTLQTAGGKSIVLEEGLHNVPVKRNWRTNVVGNVLTGDIDFKVTVDPIYYSTATVSTVAEFKTALADRNIQVIKLAEGEYDLVYVHTKGTKVIESADKENPATIKGILAIGANATIEFSDLCFNASSANSLQATGHQYIDRFERKSIVPIYAGKAKFTNCKFYDLYNSHNVVAINYHAHKPGVMLEIDNCHFEGFAYTIYSRALVSVTNSTFSQYHTTEIPRAIFLYGLGDGTNGKVIFKNNKATNKQSYALQMSSANYNYKNIEFDVQGNTNFEVDGTPYLKHPDRNFEGCTFAEGSATF